MIDEISEFITNAYSQTGIDDYRISIVFLPYGSKSLIDKSERLFRLRNKESDDRRKILYAGFEKKKKLDGNETYSFRIDGELYSFTESKMMKIHDCFEGPPTDCRRKFQIVSFRLYKGAIMKNSIHWIKGRLVVNTMNENLFILSDDQYNGEDREHDFFKEMSPIPTLGVILSLDWITNYGCGYNFFHYRWKKATLNDRTVYPD